eukprot:1151802-Pelagomonas_calceolata.AAC.4
MRIQLKRHGAYKLKLDAVGPTSSRLNGSKSPLLTDSPTVSTSCAGHRQSMSSWQFTLKSHENSNCHQKRGTAWMRKQKDKAGWQARFGKAAEYTALQRAGQTANPQLHTLHMRLRCPITDVP